MKNYTLFILLIVYLLSFLDRQIITILAEDIKGDLALSDTQLGLLTGLAFAVFFELSVKIDRQTPSDFKMQCFRIFAHILYAVHGKYFRSGTLRVSGVARNMPPPHPQISMLLADLEK